MALRFASMRARKTGEGIVLLRVIEPSEFKPWPGIEALMREEARVEAERLLQKLAEKVNRKARILPELAVREGRKRDEVIALVKEDKEIRVLVLGAAPGPDGPGPLVESLAGRMSGDFPIPIAVIPGTLSDPELEDLT
ncbi:MAG: universal stress protein [Alphaproteobacteria bacterium]|nr:universal stress protein [Alphaproteobacteria bacterium]